MFLSRFRFRPRLHLFTITNAIIITTVTVTGEVVTHRHNFFTSGVDVAVGFVPLATNPVPLLSLALSVPLTVGEMPPKGKKIYF